MGDFDILDHWGDETKLDDFGRWAVGLYYRLQLSRLEAAGKPEIGPVQPSVALNAEDMIRDILSPADFTELCRVNDWASKRLAQQLPDDPTFAQAAEALAENVLLGVVRTYASLMLYGLFVDERLHLPREGLPRMRIRNLFCETGQVVEHRLFQAAVFTALYFRFSPERTKAGVIDELLVVFHSVGEILFNLLSSIYATRRVLVCRKAFSVFARSLGQVEFFPAFEEYVRCRKELDHELTDGKDAEADQGAGKRGPKGRRQQISVKYAALAYQVSEATICNWDKKKGSVPLHYPGRDVPIDQFNNAASMDMMVKGHQEGVVRRVESALDARKRVP